MCGRDLCVFFGLTDIGDVTAALQDTESEPGMNPTDQAAETKHVHTQTVCTFR